MSQSEDFQSALKEPATRTPTGLTTGISPSQRLSMAMRQANEDPSADYGVTPGARWSTASLGVPNPFGPGVNAFEPNTQLLDALVPKAEGEKLAGVGALPSQKADGQVSGFVNAALALAQRRVPYVWGGTTSNGVDCSGLIYYAANAAGIQLNGKAWPRLRAADYGRLGTAVSLNDARPGDIIYYDEPGGTDHVGIYLGNGQMVQSPTTGDVVKISSVGRPTSIRRIFEDGAFGQIALPTGQVTSSYNGTAYNPGQNIGGINQAPAPGSTIYRPISPTAGGNVRARAI